MKCPYCSEKNDINKMKHNIYFCKFCKLFFSKEWVLALDQLEKKLKEENENRKS